jgi:hypothetical protein
MVTQKTKRTVQKKSLASADRFSVPPKEKKTSVRKKISSTRRSPSKRRSVSPKPPVEMISSSVYQKTIIFRGTKTTLAKSHIFDHEAEERVMLRHFIQKSSLPSVAQKMPRRSEEKESYNLI